MDKVLRITGWVLGLLVILLMVLLSVFAYWYLRPNEAIVDNNIVMSTWDIINDSEHNSNTDLINWQGKFYLAYVSSPFHFGSNMSILHVIVSNDQGHTWGEVESFNPPGEDIRDPKFMNIGNQLFLYALKNTSFIAEPYDTVYSYTEDGRAWTNFELIPGFNGWLFRRPKTLDGITFYNAACWNQHEKTVLLKSADGIKWEIISTIYQGDWNDETEIQFKTDGSIIVAARLEFSSFADGAFGDIKGATLITVSSPPFTEWTELTKSRVTRLDGPYLFSYHNRIYAIGRYQPDLGHSGPFTDQGSIFAKKRTSVFEVRSDGLAYLTDLPSSGDTSYVGLVIDGNTGFVSYYTSPINRDYSWILGMLSPTSIRMAEINLKTLEALADQTEAK